MLGLIVIFVAIHCANFDSRFIHLETVANTVHSTVDTTKNVAAAAVEKGTSFVGSAKGSSFLLSTTIQPFILLLISSFVHFIFSHNLLFVIFNIFYLPFVDTVANTVNSTVDTTKSVAASAVDKGSSLIGSAKDTVASTYDATKNVAASAVDTGVSYATSAKGSLPYFFVFFFLYLFCF